MTTPGRNPDRAEPAQPVDEATKARLDQAQTSLDNQREHYGKTGDNEQDVAGEARGGEPRPVRNDT